MFASIFFVSCGLPKNPFIVETKIVRDSTLPFSISPDPESSIYFDIIYLKDTIYNSNGFNILYCYSSNNSIVLSSNLQSIDSTNSSQPQKIVINSETFNLFTFKLLEESYTRPTVLLDSILPTLGTDSINGEITAKLDGSKAYLDLSLFKSSSTTSLYDKKRLLRYSGIGEQINSIHIVAESEIDYPTNETLDLDEKYFLHLFAAYYAIEPAYEVDHDNIIADTAVTYLGSVELP